MLKSSMTKLWGLLFLVYTLQWQSLKAEMICPAMITYRTYTAVAEWYSSASLENKLLRVDLHLDQNFGATCFVSNLTCDFLDNFKQYASYINIAIAELGEQTGYQVTVSYTPITTLSGNYSVIWQLQYGSYVESCLLKFGTTVDECSSPTNPCFNGGTCKDLDVGYNCTCSSGFFGYVCDHGTDKFCSISSSLIVLSTINKSADVILSCQNLNLSTNRTSVEGTFLGDLLTFNGSVLNKTTLIGTFTLATYKPGVHNLVDVFSVLGGVNHRLITFFIYNPPNFTYDFVKKIIAKNITVGTDILIMTANTDNLPSLLNYSVTDSDKDTSMAYYFGIDQNGILQVRRPLPINVLPVFNITLQVTDTMTHQFDSSIVEVSIENINKLPQCTALKVPSVYKSVSNATFSLLNCTDPEGIEQFINFKLTVTAAPPSITVTVNQNGTFTIVNRVPNNITRFYLNITVQNNEFEQYFNFTVPVINDYPYCNISKTVLLLSQMNLSDHLHITCDTIDPGNVYNMTFNGADGMPTLSALRFSISQKDNSTMSFNISLSNYLPKTYNVTLNVIVNGFLKTEQITVFVYNPPTFTSHFYKITVYQNVSVGSNISLLQATTESLAPFVYSFIGNSMGMNPSSYFTVDSAGNLQAVQAFPNSLVSTFNLTLQVIDTQTNQSDVSIVQVTVVDINEPPECTLNYVSSVNMSSLSSNSNTSIAIINCTDPDINDNFKRLNYSVQTVPSSVQVTIDVNGYVSLSNNIPNNTTSFQVFVTVRDIEFEKQLEFKINVTNDLPPSCISSKNVLVLWETHRNESINVTCDISSPATMYNLSYMISNIDCPYILTAFITKTSLNVVTATISLSTYRASKCNITFQISNSLIKTGKSTVQNVTVLVYNPPKFSNAVVHIFQNISRDSYILNVSATSDSPQPLQYSIVNATANGLEADLYFTINQNGIILPVSDIPNSLVGSLNLTIKATDTLTNLSSLALFTVVIEDVNEPPNCAIVNRKPINLLTPPKSNLSHVLCYDSDVTPAFTRLTYKVKAEPDLVNITEDGDIYLLSKINDSVKTINITVYISDISTVVLVNYIHVITNHTCEERQEQGVTFNYTLAGSNFTAACPINYEGYILRFCNDNKTWEDFSFINCVRQSLNTITNKTKEIVANQENFTTEEIKQQILNIVVELNSTFTNQAPPLSGDIKQTVSVLQDISTLVEKRNVTVSDDILHQIATISNTLLSAHKDIWTDLLNQYQTTGSAIVYLVDFFSNNSLSDISTYSLIPTPTFDIVRDISVDDIVFPKPNDTANSNDWTTKLFLSKEAFSGAGEIKYAVVHYKDVVEKFQVNKTLQNLFNETAFLKIASTIITFSVLRNETIKKDLKLSLQVNNNTSNLQPNCGFLSTSFSTFNELGLWSSYGCTLESHINNTVNCSCNHLTNFAILMSPFELEPESSLALSIISTIGCGISIFCLVVTIIVYLVVWKHVKGDRSLLHLNLCVCLIICYILFLAGVDKREDEVGCKVIAALMHFFYLAVFLTMFAEGIQICKAVVFVFKKESIIHILFPFIYGIPLVIVAISLGATKTEGYISDNYCWLSVHKGLIWAFVGPVLFVLLFNFIILIITLRVMQSTAVHRLKSKSEKLKSVVRTIYMLSPILGLTWIFGVLSVNSDLVVFQYLFAICNSLQGLFVFLCYCVLSHQIREGISNLRKRGHSKSSVDSGIRGTDSSAKNDSETKTLRLGSSSSQEEEMNVLSIPPIRKNLAFTNIRYGAYE